MMSWVRVSEIIMMGDWNSVVGKEHWENTVGTDCEKRLRNKYVVSES